MGICTSRQVPITKEELAKQRAIEKQLRKDRKKLEHEVKLLLLGMQSFFSIVPQSTASLSLSLCSSLGVLCFCLLICLLLLACRVVLLCVLGAGESGKSTFAKQMKIIYLTGFDAEEKKEFVDVVHSNVLMNMRALLLAAKRLEIPLEEKNQVCVCVCGGVCLFVFPHVFAWFFELTRLNSTRLLPPSVCLFDLVSCCGDVFFLFLFLLPQKLAEEFGPLHNPISTQVVDAKMAAEVKQLWADTGIQKVYIRENEFQLSDSAK
jgi:G-protein alpha subunit